MLLLLRGPVSVPALRYALATIVRRHEILRTAFLPEGDAVVQVACPPGAVRLPVVEVPGARLDPADDLLSAAVRRDMAVPLDLARGRPFRPALYRIGAEEHVLGLTAHHLVTDLWSYGILGHELGILYAARLAGDTGQALPDLRIQYGDYAAWQRSWLSGERVTAALEARVRALRGAPPLMSFPPARARPAVQDCVGAAEWFRLGRDLADRLRAWSRGNGVTPYMTLLAVFKALLARHCGLTDIAIVTPIANRGHAELEQLIGCFVNLIAIRTSLAGDPAFTELAHRVRAACLDAYAHRDVPFDRLVSGLRPYRTRSHAPVAQVAFVLQNTPVRDLVLDDLNGRFHEMDTGRSRLDLSVRITETADGLSGELEYDTALYSAGQVRAIGQQFETLLRAALAAPHSALGDLPVLGPREHARIVSDWNATGTPLGDGELVHEMVEAQALRTPGACAVAAGGRRLCYQELNERANRLAWHLRGLGAGPEVPVAVCLPASVAEAVAVLAVLKSGACCVPVDAAGPPRERDQILGELRPGLVLTTSDLADELWAPQRRIVTLEPGAPAIPVAASGSPRVRMSAGSLAFILFGSPSGGRPAGVMVSHRGVANWLRWGQREFPLSGSSRVLRDGGGTPAAAVAELLRALCGGAASVLAPGPGGREAGQIAAVIEEHSVTDASFSPARLAELLAAVPAGRLPSLSRITCGPGPLTPAAGRRARARLDAELVQVHGTAETSGAATAWRHRPDDDRGFVPIGRPIASMRAYVLGPDLRPVPPGVPGELCLGGAGVARGYFGRPGLTAARFVPDPFSGSPGARLFRTGDLARQDGDGVLQFLGRARGQLSLRGYHVDPQQVAASLEEFAGVTEAVVTTRPAEAGQEDQLVAYLACAWPPPDRELRAHLRSRLPSFLMPAALIPLRRIPRGRHGQLAAAALPSPAAAAEGTAGRAPAGAAERAIAAIWRDVLGCWALGADDDFHACGGDSLAAVRIIARVNRELGADLDAAALLRAPTVAGLARQLASAAEPHPGGR